MISEERGIECLKLAKTYACKYKKFTYIYDNFEDYVSTLVVKLLSVLDLYEETKGSFTTFAFTVFNNEVKRTIRANNAVKRLHENVSLDQAIASDSNKICLSDVLCEESSDIDKLIDKDECKCLFNAIAPYLSSIYIDAHVKGMKQKDLAVKYGISQSYVSRKLSSEQQFINNVFHDRPIKYMTEHRSELKTAIESIKNDYIERVK